MKYVLLSLSLLFAFGCKQEVDGNLNVHNTIQLKWKTGLITVEPGSYGANIRVSSDEKIKLTFHGRKEYHSFRFPKGTRLPSRRGEIFIPSEQARQPYDVLAKVDSNVRESGIRREWESCYYQRPYRMCQSDSRGRRRCWTEYRTVYGQREVEFVDVYTDRFYDIDFLEPGTRAISAHFNGEDSSYDRRYLSTGHCY